MGTINPELLLREVSPDAPCGADLSYDPAYMEIERLARGTPEQQMGSQVVPAVEPNWKDVRDRCVALFSKTKDLRVALYLCLALAQTAGVEGLRDGLLVLKGLLEKYWDRLYPPLDPTDRSPALERINILASLSPAATSFEDPMKFRQRLMDLPLTQSARVGRFSLRNILVAKGELAAPQGGPPPADLAISSAAFDDTDATHLQGLDKDLGEARGLVKAVHDAIEQQAGAGNAPDFDGVMGVLMQMQTNVQEALTKRGLATAGGVAPAAATPGAPAAAQGLGDIRSPQDVLKALDRICQFYEKNEPSSPVPLLMRRAQRLVGKSFVDIVRDVSPDAVKQVETLGGIAGE